MYLPAHFAESRLEILRAAMRDYPLATLVTLAAADAGPVTSPLPLLWQPGGAHGVLRGHLARANPAWAAHPPGAAALALFHGPQAYVSPRAYPGKRLHGKAVPTWNYVIVEARGRLAVIDDAAWLRRLLAAQTAAHEAADLAACGAAGEIPWQLDDAPADYLATMLRAVVGVELAIESLVGKWKLSQNQPAENRAGVIAALAARADPDARALAALMRAGTTAP